VLLGLLVERFVPEGPLVVGIDETLERRQGKKIEAKGIYRDPVRSSHSHFVKTSALRWVCVTLLAEVPWASKVWALPFVCALARFDARPSRHPGYTSLYDPVEERWHDFPTADCYPSVVSLAGKRRKGA